MGKFLSLECIIGNLRPISNMKLAVKLALNSDNFGSDNMLLVVSRKIFA